MQFKLIGEATRVRILLTLGEGMCHVGALTDTLGQTPAGVSHHLAVLRLAQLVAIDRQGKRNHYGLTEAGARFTAMLRQMAKP